MKKSNLVVLAAILVLLLSLGVYNSALKAEYLSGSYKDPYHDFTELNLKNFDAVAVNAASEVSVTIKQGKTHRVQIRKNFEEFLQIKKEGNTAVIQVNYPKDRENFGGHEVVVITVPQLKSVSADAQYMVAGKKEPRQNTKKNRSWTTLKIQGFTQDSLLVEQTNRNTVEFTGNKLGFLRAIAGKDAGSESSIIINKDNTIGAANLDMRNRSNLKLNHIFIPNLTYQFSDSAHVEMSGAALAILKK